MTPRSLVRTAAGLATLCACAVACPGEREEGHTTPAAGSTVAARIDSVGPDTVRDAAPGAAPDTLPTVTTASKSLTREDSIRSRARTRQDSILGRDSAFGPRFTIDADGKVRPIRKP